MGGSSIKVVGRVLEYSFLNTCWVCVIFFACVCVGASDMTTASDDPSY
jgi:hypothetical protein